MINVALSMVLLLCLFSKRFALGFVYFVGSTCLD